MSRDDAIMTNERPDPDALLARVRADEARAGRGRLKVFFGAAPGVGKTYAMLEEARARRAEGVDVLAGVVETHGRKETMALLDGLEVLPRRTLEYRGVSLQEFDLDAALARRPGLLLVDELAHTNAPGSRHVRRWQDVEELIDAGIDVYTTLNVQHLESLNDVVARITGVEVRETVPDAVLDAADQIEVADLSPDDLLQRLEAGKVYVPEQARRAIARFFRKGNLIALRELALRRAAERVDAQMRGYMREHGIRDTWPAGDRILVCVGHNPHSARLVRAARRMAAGLRCEWIALHVETPGHERLPARDRDTLVANLHLAEELGALIVTLYGLKATDEILAYARRHNVTRIIVGKPTHPRWRDLLVGSLLEGLVRGSGDIDVYVISGDEPEDAPRRAGRREAVAPGQYGWAVMVVAACTALNWLVFRHLNITDTAMVYLVGTVLVAARARRGPAVVASVLSIAAFDFFFVPPLFTFTVSDVNYFATFGVMLATTLLISAYTLRIRDQAEAAREREHRTGALYAMSRALAAAGGATALARAARRHIVGTLDADAVILLRAPDGTLTSADPGEPPLDEKELSVARWVADHGTPAGHATDTLPAARGLYVPLAAPGGVVGVLGLYAKDERRFDHPTTRQLLDALANQTALAIERAQLAERNAEGRVEMEAERLRTSLLSSLSHDLRTPLGAITGAASSLKGEAGDLSPGARAELLDTILEEASRMNRLIGNLLDMIRLESGSLAVKPDWQPLEEVVGVALIRLDARLKERPVTTSLPPDLPMVAMDGLLIEQVLVNLLENAAKYTPAGTPIELTAVAGEQAVTIAVLDRGPGVPPGEEARIFDKFHHVADGRAAGGIGLGLTICRGIVLAHGGRIWAENREGAGLAVRFTLPTGTPPPVTETEEATPAAE